MSAALQLIERPDTSELAIETTAIVADAKALTIVDSESYRFAVEFMNGCAALRKKIVEKFSDPKKKAKAAHQAICDLEEEQLEPVDLAEREAKRKIAGYHAEQERLRQEEQRRLAEEARRREEERLLAEALEAEAEGDDAAAAEIISAPVEPPPVRVAPATPRVAGVQIRETWSARVVNLHALVKYVAAHPECVNYLTPNITALNQIARAQKDAARIDGVVISKESNVAAGGRR